MCASCHILDQVSAAIPTESNPKFTYHNFPKESSIIIKTDRHRYHMPPVNTLKEKRNLQETKNKKYNCKHPSSSFGRRPTINILLGYISR